MALKDTLPNISDVGTLQGTFGSDIVDIPLVNAPYTTIVNRAQMYDLSRDLGLRMAGNRHYIQQIYLLPNEQGPNGEPVWGVANDFAGQIRLVGSWVQQTTAFGSEVFPTNPGFDYAEFSWYGTACNFASYAGSGAADYRATVDNGAEGANLIPSNLNSIITGRGYAANQVLPIVKGLSVGHHTVRVRSVTLSRDFNFFESVNESTSIRVNVGTIWKDGAKRYNSSQLLATYNTNFESGVLGSKGGLVSVYQKVDGSIAKSVTPVNSSAQYLASADHSNEEISRIYNVGEFANVANQGSSEANRADSLEDGTASLNMRLGQFIPAVVSSVPNSIQIGASTTGLFSVFTFTGCGVDVIAYDTSTTINTYTAQIDGAASVGSFTNVGTANVIRVRKVASGLGYGSHTLKITGTTNAAGALRIIGFIVYQPKKPTIPSGAVEVGNYNILANYDGSTITGTANADNVQIAGGVLTKHLSRELVYIGANWTSLSLDPASYPLSGYNTGTLTNNNQPYQLTFTGTGFVVHNLTHSGQTYDFTVTVDGVLNASGVARSNATNLGGGSYRSTAGASGNEAVRVEFTGLTMGVHTIQVQRTAGTGNFSIVGVHIITPIHSNKNNGPLVWGNTLSIGSVGISDSRKTKDMVMPDRFPTLHCQDRGSNTNQTGSSYIIVLDAGGTFYAPKNGYIDIDGILTTTNTANNGTSVQIFVNGYPISTANFAYATAGMASAEAVINVRGSVPVGQGYNRVELYFASSSGGTSTIERRVLNVTFRA